MHVRLLTLAAASAVLLAGSASGIAAGRAKCSSIYAVCLQRAGNPSAICENMYKTALADGQWQATEEPDGTKHAAVPCTK